MPDEHLLFYLNLTGELFYIISHRMKSQAVQIELQKTVHDDLAIAIMNPIVIQDLIAGQSKWLGMTFSEIKSHLSRIVHSSIMTVNEYSMDKLFELTLIATKYQYTVCPYPKDILLIALNHLDSIRKYISENYAIQLSENLHYSIVDSYGKLPGGKMQEFRLKILDYLLEVRLKMTNLIKLGLQDAGSGLFIRTPFDRLIHPECVKPGSMEIYEYSLLSDKLVSTHIVQFDNSQLKTKHRKQHSLELNGDRVIILGQSIYEPEYRSMLSELDEVANNFVKTPKGLKSPNLHSPSSCGGEENNFAIPGLTLCGTLLGCEINNPIDTSSFSVNFSHGGDDEEDPNSNKTQDRKGSTQSSDVNVIRIDGSNRKNVKAPLAAIAREFSLEKDNKELQENDVNSLIDSMIDIGIE